MREVSGSTWVFQLMIIFILIFACFLCLVINYSKAYRVKNEVLSIIEKYEGMFPTWLCPEQVRILPISEKYHDYAAKVRSELEKNDIRCTVDERSEKIGYKIREARLARVPYMLVVGQKEEEEGVVSVRSRYKGDEGQRNLSDFITEISEEIRTKEIRKIEVSRD